jgi:Fe-S-cluster containining protein
MDDVKEVKQEMQRVNEAIFDILNYYICPPECHAFCCKQCAVDLSDKEYNKLRRLSREKADKLKTVKYNRTYSHQLDTPCPFLGHDELCTAYDIRPVKCHTYPFNMTVTSSSLVMLIYPCMMGRCSSYI